MVRIARIVAPGTPYHITHRGNQRREVFFCDRDRELYLADLAVWAHDCGLSIWGYCLMTNHVHLVAVPHHAESMARAIGEQLRRATLTGRPCGGEDLIDRLERQLGRRFECRKPGPKPANTLSEDENQYELF